MQFKLNLRNQKEDLHRRGVLMRRLVISACYCIVAAVLMACHGKASPVAPSGGAPTATVVLQFNQAVHRDPNSFSLTVKGKSNSDELINALPLAEPLRSNESWSGAVMRLLEWTTSTAITTNVPFTPPSQDHFQFDDVKTSGSIDISLELIPGGQPVGGPFHNIRIMLDSNHVQLPSGYTTSSQDGRIHVKGALPK